MPTPQLTLGWQSRASCRFAEHAVDVDCDKERFSARENFALGIQNLSAIGVLAAFHADRMAFGAQRLVQRDWRQVVDLHGAGQGDYVVDLVDLAHDLIQDGGYDAAVNVSWRAHKAVVEAKAADITVAGFVVSKTEFQAGLVVLAADEAAIFL